jgi:hypothetical protein
MGSLGLTALFGLLAVVATTAYRRIGLLRHAQIDEQSQSRDRVWGVLWNLTWILLAIPIAVFATLAAVPLWWLLEWITGWHIVGHAGPDEWCYILAYAIVLFHFGRLRSIQRTKPRAVAGGDAGQPHG